MPSLKTIINGTCLEDKYIANYDDLKRIIRQFKEGGFKISMTQGVYDMFHVGHGRYLREARSYGDILIVGVDSDELTREMKGPNRPFDTFPERIEVLSMLGFVNIIAKRDVGQHKYDLIKLVEPDVLIMSKTTKSFDDEDITALTPFCGEIVHLEAKAAKTTTAKMLRIMTEGAQSLADKISKLLTDFFNEMGVTQ